MRQHWWYRGRRAAVASLLRRAGIPHDGRVLDYGCGTGHMGAVLAGFGVVCGVEGSEEAVRFGSFDAYAELRVAASPGDPQFPPGPYSLISLLDVLEHVPDERQLLAALTAELERNGRIVASVPMDPSLFCEVDVLAGHQRRYTRASFNRLIGDAGLEIEATTGYVVTLLPLARMQRRRVMAGRVELPAGLSWITVLRRTPA